MASVLKVDSITGVTTAGSVSVQGEGSATTNLQQGLAKAWNSVASQASTDSFNVSSVTDVSAGQLEDNFTNNFAAATYSSPACAGGGSNIQTFIATNWYDAAKYTTSLSRTGTYLNATGYTDSDFYVARFGDLA